MIEVKGLYKNFGNLEVLKDRNKTINKGEVVAITESYYGTCKTEKNVKS